MFTIEIKNSFMWNVFGNFYEIVKCFVMGIVINNEWKNWTVPETFEDIEITEGFTRLNAEIPGGRNRKTTNSRCWIIKQGWKF